MICMGIFVKVSGSGGGGGGGDEPSVRAPRFSEVFIDVGHLLMTPFAVVRRRRRREIHTHTHTQVVPVNAVRLYAPDAVRPRVEPKVKPVR